MTDNSLQFLTVRERNKFQTLFEEKKNHTTNRIPFLDFGSIIRALGCFTSSVVNTYLDGIKKEIKIKTSNDNEASIMITQNDYYKYLNQLIVENNRYLNEHDTDFYDLFKLLTGNKETISKKCLMEILTTFAIPIDFDIFFAYVEKKEELSFEDFCCLFKPAEQKEIFKKTFNNGFDLSDKGINDKDNVFPIFTDKQ